MWSSQADHMVMQVRTTPSIIIGDARPDLSHIEKANDMANDPQTRKLGIDRVTTNGPNNPIAMEHTGQICVSKQSHTYSVDPFGLLERGH